MSGPLNLNCILQLVTDARFQEAKEKGVLKFRSLGIDSMGKYPSHKDLEGKRSDTNPLRFFRKCFDDIYIIVIYLLLFY